MNNYTERRILLNERFYWTIVQWDNKRNRWKINDNFENGRNQIFFEQLKKERNGSFSKDERTKWKKAERANISWNLKIWFLNSRKLKFKYFWSISLLNIYIWNSLHLINDLSAWCLKNINPKNTCLLFKEL